MFDTRKEYIRLLKEELIDSPKNRAGKEIYINPTGLELRDCFFNSTCELLRGVFWLDNFIIWDAYQLTHTEACDLIAGKSETATTNKTIELYGDVQARFSMTTDCITVDKFIDDNKKIKRTKDLQEIATFFYNKYVNKETRDYKIEKFPVGVDKIEFFYK